MGGGLAVTVSRNPARVRIRARKRIEALVEFRPELKVQVRKEKGLSFDALVRLTAPAVPEVAALEPAHLVDEGDRRRGLKDYRTAIRVWILAMDLAGREVEDQKFRKKARRRTGRPTYQNEANRRERR